MSETRITGEGARFAAVLDLDHPTSADPEVAGAKAAALATARRSGLPALPGFVLSVDAATIVASGSKTLPAVLGRAVRAAWERLAADGQPVIVRSSSPVEDGRTSSMAGRFRSVLAVRGWDEFRAAVREVVASADGNPMAVLVQSFLRPAWGGVLFGADPVTGRADRLVVAAVPGGPDRLVSGEVSGSQMALSPGGRLLDTSGVVDRRLRRRSTRRSLVRLAGDAARLFGGPQDIEWAIDDGGHLILLQSRPITTVGEAIQAGGPVLGPGPVAETFPSVLAPLEDDLWIPPLREGLRRALSLTGAAPRRQLRSSPVVVTVQGRAAVDLDLLGLSPVRRSRLAFLDPRPPARRLVAAWRVGRLRAGLPLLASDLLATVDAELRAVPALDRLAPAKLLDLVDRAAEMLVSLHGHEVLAGQLLPADTTAPTAASTALRVLAEARATTPGATAEELIARHPVLLSLPAPAIGRELVLPLVLPPPTRLAPMAAPD
ncbi:MAG: PEP/pyruvate-binding domain-containing protein, partial [Acidimicrobiales bacterium]